MTVYPIDYREVGQFDAGHVLGQDLLWLGPGVSLVVFSAALRRTRSRDRDMCSLA